MTGGCIFWNLPFTPAHNISSTVKETGEGSFSDCRQLLTVELREWLELIQAFDGCDLLYFHVHEYDDNRTKQRVVWLLEIKRGIKKLTGELLREHQRGRSKVV